jgi:hypothetical protein
MPRVDLHSVTVSDEDLLLIQELLAHVNQTDFCTHGQLTVEKLAAMLLEDVALAWRRPGSWEGSNMCQLLAGHGYRL